MKTDKTKKRGKFRYVSLGDVHLGHRGTPAAHIIRNLNKLLPDQLLKEIDMLIITGDLFDRQLQNGDDVVHTINRWMTELMYRCAAFNVMIRCVEGTPSHDREQSKFFVEQMINAKIPVDLYYTNQLEIRYEPKLDAHFLYVPDKWRPCTEITLSEVKGEMMKLGIDQVDFAIMHGAFSYQLPSIVEEPTHDEEEYNRLVKYQILIGHVHIMTVRGKIHAAGSLDRICHGDEIAKGMFDITVKEDGNYTCTFVENRGAKRYDTLDVHGQDTKELNLTVKTRVNEIPKGSAIRLRCDPHDVATGDLNYFIKEYPQIEWTLAIEKSTKKKNTVLESMRNFNMSEWVPITRDNLVELIAIEMHRQGQCEDTIDRCATRLNDIIKVK